MPLYKLILLHSTSIAHSAIISIAVNLRDSSYIFSCGAFLTELNIDCISDEREEVRALVFRELNVSAKHERSDSEFELFNEFDKALRMPQLVVENVDKVSGAISQELYRIYKECDDVEIKRRIEIVIENLKKNLDKVS